MFAHIRSFKFAAVLAVVSFFSSVGVASAAAPCGSHDAIAKSLTTKFKEARRVMGVVNAKRRHGNLHVATRHLDRAGHRHHRHRLRHRHRPGLAGSSD